MERVALDSHFQWRQERGGLIGHQESFDEFSLYNVPLHDFLYIRLGGDAVPHAFGIDHHAWPLSAIIEAAGFVGANDPFEIESFRLLFETGVQGFRAELGAAASWIVSFPLVRADENMSLVACHAIRPVIAV